MNVSRRTTLLGAVATALIPAISFARADESATPVEATLAPGVRHEPITGTPDLPVSPPRTSVRLTRFFFESGATLDLPFAGPTQLYVEEGDLTVDEPANGFALMGFESDAAGFASGAPIRVRARSAIHVEDGQFGSRRNEGETRLVVLAIMVVTQPEGETTDVTGDATAVPMK